MSKLPEIIDLFARLASNLQTLNPTVENEDQSLDLLISNLNQSLNLSEHSRVRVLDTALSLMCFTAPQVFDSVIEYSVKTIVTVLSSLVKCKVLRIGGKEVLQIGGLISSSDCVEVIEKSADVLGKLEGHGILSGLLLYAVVRVAVSALHFRHLLQLTPVIDVKSIDGRSPALSKLLCHLPKEISLQSQAIPLRLLFWYLDPLILKHDVSQMLQDAIKRPFLCLYMEFYERMEWRSIIICLVISPAMFIETRALLHNWFLATGLASVLELQIELASLVLDVVSRPMWWGISAEVGSKLPFSHAYFPYQHRLLRTLAGPLTCEGFLHLVQSISQSVYHARRHSDPTLNQAATKIAMVDHKSMWAVLLNFPEWFYFASVLLFSEKSFQNSFHSKCTFGAAETKQSHDEGRSCSAAAPRYIAWILNPISKSHQDLLAECLNKISGSSTLKQVGSDKQNKATSAYRKKLKKPKFHDKEDENSLEYDCQTIRLWVKEFQDMYVRYYNRTVNNAESLETKTSHGIGLQQNALFRRISLGILIGCSNPINDDGCELLLHYVATGTIIQSTEASNTGLKHRRWNSEWQDNSIIGTEKCNRKEAAAGACVVFNLTDVAEHMSPSMFETEESGVDFICRVKLRTGKYLLKCIKRLVQLKIEQDGLLVRDLHSRLVRWRRQGKDVFQGNKDLDDAIAAMTIKLSSS